MAMIPVAEAQERLIAMIKPLGAEQVPVSEALGRVLAEDVIARRTAPPWAVSAMDGYAVRAADVARVPTKLKVVGAVPAGQAYPHPIKAGEAVRIFTGAPVPDGADAIVIQEDTDREGDLVLVREGAPTGRYVRPAGLDFKEGEVGLKAGRKLSAEMPTIQREAAEAGRSYMMPIANQLARDVQQELSKQGGKAAAMPAKPAPPAVFILSSGERLESSHYLVSSESVQVEQGDTQRTIPISALNVDATVAANRARGIDLKIPGKGQIMLGF